MVKLIHLTFIAVLLAALNFEVQSQETTTTETTTAVPPSGPSLIDLIVAIANFSEPCDLDLFNPALPLLTYCNTYGRTVACIANICQCNLGEDAVFHEGWNLCVSKVDSLCFAEANGLGRKVCVENADCFPDKGSADYNVGTCKCLYGYVEDTNGECKPDPGVPDNLKSTLRPTTTKLPRQTVTTGPTTTEGTGPTTTKGSGGGGGSAAGNITSSGAVIISMLYIMTKLSMF